MPIPRCQQDRNFVVGDMGIVLEQNLLTASRTLAWPRMASVRCRVAISLRGCTEVTAARPSVGELKEPTRQAWSFGL